VLVSANCAVYFAYEPGKVLIAVYGAMFSLTGSANAVLVGLLAGGVTIAAGSVDASEFKKLSKLI
jgi:hypothetical protein